MVTYLISAIISGSEFILDSSYLGCMRLINEQLNWGKKAELKAEVLAGIKEIGSVLYWIGLLDIVLVSPSLHPSNELPISFQSCLFSVKFSDRRMNMCIREK